VISTVDPQARHGHKTSSRGFDGYKGHVAIDPDSELITATAVAAANVGDAAVADRLLADDLPDASDDQAADAEPEPEPEPAPAAEDQRLVVYGDSGYGAGALIERLEHADVDIRCKLQAPTAPAGHFTKDDFDIDLKAGAVTCPAGQIGRCGHSKTGRSPASAPPARVAPWPPDAPTHAPAARSVSAATSAS
jgi:Transposase DDE domain